MLFPVALLIPIGATLACFLWFRNRAVKLDYWRSAARVAGIAAGLRVGLVALGAYLLENTSGWLQLPGYAMALCGLPEIYLLPQRTWGTAGALTSMAVVMVPGTAAWTFALAGLASRGAPPTHQDR
jgi:hypothetical protein